MGIEAVTHFLNRDDSLTGRESSYVIELLEFATKHNYFWFDKKNSLQQRGVAKGAKFAPSLANLFVAKWEEDVFYSEHRPSLVLWGRYMDDILLLWDGTPESLKLFFAYMNENYQGISLYEFSSNKIHFLDLEIEISSRQFKFQTYLKPTDHNSFIPIDSCHHRSWPHSVPRSQFVRLRRNCINIDTFIVQA